MLQNETSEKFDIFCSCYENMWTQNASNSPNEKGANLGMSTSEMLSLLLFLYLVMPVGLLK